jgi:exonuclease SbcD
MVFDAFLVELAKRKIEIFIISGNHDSSERLAFGNKLFDASGVHISPVYNGTFTKHTLTDSYGTLNVYMLPFIKPTHVRKYTDAEVNSYTDAVKIAIEQMNVCPSERNILITHQFVTGAERSESEDVSVGGSDNVDASIMEGFDYVALGHLHKPQSCGKESIRYCGSALKYSFSEAGHYKSITVVELGSKEELTLHTVPLIPRHDMREIRGTFAQLMDKAYYSSQTTDDYLHIILTDEEDVPEAVGRLRVVYTNLMKLTYDNTRTRVTQIVGSAENVKRKSSLQLFEELYEKQNNQPMSEVQRAFAQELIEKIQEDML